MSGYKQQTIVAFESRLAEIMENGIRKHGGLPLVAPSMQEIPLEKNVEAYAFGERLIEGRVDLLILMTGVGLRMLVQALEVHYPRTEIIEALRKTTLLARGPKPVAVLREFGLTPDMTVPEPNTWVQVLETLDTEASGVSIHGRTVAVQEYGVSNEQLVEGLKKRGAAVIQVPVYRWTLPDDTAPLTAAIDVICRREAALVLFTTGVQIRHVLKVAAAEGKEKLLREGLAHARIASIGPTCSESLAEQNIRVDFEPSHPKLGHLISESARYYEGLSQANDPDGAVFRLIQRSAAPEDGRELRLNSPMMRACRGEETAHTPVWLMRQAGRYMKEYRAIRSRQSFLELCKNKDLCAEITVHAQEKIGADAAIIFSDLLVIVEPFGLGLEYVRGDGPQISGEIASAGDVASLPEVEPEESLRYVADAIRLTRRCLKPEIPLIGFAGCPFTLASYMIEGGASRSFQKTKRFMYSEPEAWHLLMRKITAAVARYAEMQIRAGADIMQFFDSWVGCLGPQDYRRYVFEHSRNLVQSIKGKVPVIHFGTGTGAFLEDMHAAGADVLGVDFHCELSQVWERLGNAARLQGNMDPLLLQAPWPVIETRAREILDQAAGRSGYIFNLGHGILPETPVENVIRLVQFVHEYTGLKQKI